jgi:16S rRNA processing protein RimM
MTEYRNIGKLSTVFGVKGEILLSHHLGKKTSLKGLEALFIEIQPGEMLPYFIETTRIRTENELLIKLDGISNPEAARRLLQKEVWLTQDDFDRYSKKSAAIALVGFKLLDKGREIGEISEVIEQSHQTLCKIRINEKEALIPLHEETLIKIDHRKKQVFTDLPEGLLDIYL